MGKTLRNIVLCLATIAAVGAGSFFIGRGIGKIQNRLQNTNYVSNANHISESILKEPENKTTKKRLENYFLQGDELKSINLSSADSPNPLVINREDFDKEGRGYPLGNRVLRGGIGKYTLPKIESDSEMRDISLEVIEFESAGDKEDFIRGMSGEVTYPLFIKDNTVSLIKPTIGESESLSPKQKEIYTSILRDYIKRTGVDAVLSGNGTEQEKLLKTIKESSVVDEKTEENNAESKISSNPNSANAPAGNITNELVNTTTSGLEKYFFQGDELRFLRLSSPYVAGTNLPNPIIVDSKTFTMSEKDRNSFETKKVLKEGIGEYILEEIESYSKPSDLFLEILEFGSESDKKIFIEKELEGHSYFSKGRILTYIQPDVQYIDQSEFTSGQKVIYINLIRNYSKRTGLDMVLSKDETENRELLNNIDKFVEKYYLEKGIPNPSKN